MKKLLIILAVVVGIVVLVYCGLLLWVRAHPGDLLNDIGGTPVAYRFADYPSGPAFTGTPKPVDFSTNAQAATFRTRITEGAKAGPNFAGHYTVIEWGCGTSCQGHAIVDEVTGRIVLFGPTTEYGVSYRLDSTLFIVNPPENWAQLSPKPAVYATDYYQLIDGNLIRLAQ